MRHYVNYAPIPATRTRHLRRHQPWTSPDIVAWAILVAQATVPGIDFSRPNNGKKKKNTIGPPVDVSAPRNTWGSDEKLLSSSRRKSVRLFFDAVIICSQHAVSLSNCSRKVRKNYQTNRLSCPYWLSRLGTQCHINPANMHRKTEQAAGVEKLSTT